MVPLGNAVFFIPGIYGHQDYNTYAIVGLIVIVIGLTIYRFYRQFLPCFSRLIGRPVPAPQISGTSILPFVPRGQNLEASEVLITENIERELPEDLLRRAPTQIRSRYFSRLGIPYNRGNSGFLDDPHPEGSGLNL